MRVLLAVALGPLALGLFVFWLWTTGWFDPNLGACDAAIKATLKAPSSYKRVSASGGEPNSFYLIEYDAVNSYNAPIRGRGMCSITKSGAEWTDTTPSS